MGVYLFCTSGKVQEPDLDTKPDSELNTDLDPDEGLDIPGKIEALI